VIARFFVAAVIAIALARPALAEPMMPAGASPEAGLAGVWRVIDAKPAPWSRQRRLTKRDAPLLAYAIEFAANEVKGPAPLACPGATYSSGVTYRDEAFGASSPRTRTGRSPRGSISTTANSRRFAFIAAPASATSTSTIPTILSCSKAVSSTRSNGRPA